MCPNLGQVVWSISIVLLATQFTDAQIPPACGGNITQQSGTIASPGYPDNYPNNKYCSWLFTAGENEVIDLRILKQDLEGTMSNIAWVDSNCPDFVRVYDGTSVNSPLIAYLCGVATPAELAKIFIRSKSRYLLVVFQSDYQGQRPGFLASFSMHECLEFMYGNETCNNACTCDKEHTDYCSNTNGKCVCKNGWTSSNCSQDIDECLNQNVELCPTDYKECSNKIGGYDCVCKAGLRDVKGACEVDQGKTCGPSHGCSHLCVKISNQEQCYCPDNMKLVGKTCEVCSNVAFGKNCRLGCKCVTSNTASCNTVTGGCICLGGWTAADCSRDINECTELLGPVCPSSEQCINTIGGYNCTCKSGNPRPPDGSCGGCSYTLTSPSGTIQSPNYPNDAYANVVCNWTIIASDPSLTIAFSMSQVSIGYLDTYSGLCNNWYGTLEIFDGINSSYPLLARYCGTFYNTGVVRTSGRVMFILFKTDPNYSKRFNGTYSVEAFQVFKSTTTDPSGIITSPAITVSPAINVVFIWTITVAPCHVVNISLPETYLGDCGSNSLDIYDGDNAGSSRLLNMCGNNTEKNIMSTNRYMTIIHSSKGNAGEKGFIATYITDACKCPTDHTTTIYSPCYCRNGFQGYYCNLDIDECLQNPCPAHSTCYNNYGSFFCACWNGTIVSVNATCDDWKKTLNGPSGEIQSHNFPNPYPNYMNYTWYISGKQTEVVTLRMSVFHVEGNVKCTYDAFEYYNGWFPDAVLIGKYCGNQFPTTLRSTKAQITIRFRTDSIISYKGFNATYYTHECAKLKYGEVKCTNFCPCTYENTKDCDNVNGACFCLDGWCGSGCSQDIDECRNKPCPKDSTCYNVPGSFYCECNFGYVMNAAGKCIESSICSAEMKKKCSHLCDIDRLTNMEKCACPEDFIMLNDGFTCVVALYPHGSVAVDSSIIDRTSTGVKVIDKQVIISSLVPFGKKFKNAFKVLPNGVIVFNGREISFPNLQDAFKKSSTLFAPFWTEKRNPIIGDVVYHVYERCGDSLFTNNRSGNTSPKELEVFERAIRDMKNLYNLPSFEVSAVIVVTWINVAITGCPDSETNTFQAIIISGYVATADSTYLEAEEISFVIFIYRDGKGICLPKQVFQVGIVTEDGVRTLKVDSSNPKMPQTIWNTGNKGQIKFPAVGKVLTDSLKCQRYLCKHAHLINDRHFQAEIDELYKCPCSLDRLGLQFQFLKDEGVAKCFAISDIAKRRLLKNNQRNRVCCYYWRPPKNDTWEDWHNSWLAGSFVPFGQLLVRDPWPWSQSLGSTNPYQEALENMHAQDWCCGNSPYEFCQKFDMIFGDTECTQHPVFVPASALGDPVISTFDGLEYLMNAVGEFVMVIVDNENSYCTLQARTSRIEISGKLSNGSSFTAFAAQEGDGHIQVQFDTTTEMMSILINKKMDFTERFYKEESFRWQQGSIFVQRINENKRIILEVSLECGLSFKVNVGIKCLEIDTEVDISLKNQTKGLLGNFNGDPNDDFILYNGTVRPSNMTERQIQKQFVDDYRVTAITTVFIYENGESFENYQNKGYEPIYFDELSQNLISEAKLICGENKYCIYDLIATGSPDFAQNTKDKNIVHEQREKRLKNNPPTLELETQTYKNSWLVYVGKKNTLNVIATDKDGDPVTIQLLGKKLHGVECNQSGQITYTPDPTNPVQIHVQACDSIGTCSPVLIIIVIVCPNCSGHGKCEPDATSAEFYNGQYQLLACNCFAAYTGESCESEFNACDTKPCSQGQDCTDLTAAEQGNSSVGHICGACPSGTTKVNGLCEDVNECENSTVCSQNCHNTYGSYMCGCEYGYKLDPKDSKTCNDVDECAGPTSGCEQECVNNAGGYDCNCGDGYTKQDNGATCVLDTNLAPQCQHCEQVCRVINNQTSCDCNRGYKIVTTDSNKCSDINECAFSPCDQKCTNTKGSYECTCHPGYMLDWDGLSCLECNATHYGENCSNTCDCRGQGLCDRVVGCICYPGWTGPNCNKDENECANSNACADGLVCTNTPGSFRCDCPSGFRLVNGICIDIDECFEGTDKCDLNLRHCVNTFGGYECPCETGYQESDDTNDCEDIDECKKSIDGCQQICINGDGGYSCGCQKGYRLAPDRLGCVKYKEVCDLKCSHGCTLDNNGNQFCFCSRGFYLEGNDTCKDINECASDDTNLCEQKDMCINTEGNYNCSCEAGFKLQPDGRSCAPCSSGTWGVECANTCACGKEAISCDPATGCKCKPGCTGTHCTEVIDQCASGERKCEPKEKCVQRGCVSICECLDGFYYNAGKCFDENECQDKTKNNCSQTCINTEGGYNCSCFVGFLYNATSMSCDDIDECQTPGLNICTQTCTNTVGSFKCSCDSGYNYNVLNNTCIDINECDRIPKPCSKICVNTNGSYECSCPQGETLSSDGINCGGCQCVESNTEHCNSSDSKCHCKKGWTSIDCSEDVDECIHDSCPDNRKCTNLKGSYQCDCLNGLQPGPNNICNDCNRQLTANTGYIMSPNYPDLYPSDSSCAWTITVESQAIIELSFLVHRLEGCPHDYISIYNGVNDQSPLLAKVCSKYRTSFKSSGNSLYIVFTSDFSVSDIGFLASYKSYVPCQTKKCSHTCSKVSFNPVIEKCHCPESMTLSSTNDSQCINMNACGATITDNAGYIVSPNYPNEYLGNTNCYWSIQGTKNNSYIKIRFYDFSVEDGINCSYDFVKIYDGKSVGAPLLANFCGEDMPPAIISSGQNMFIVLKTDSTLNFVGFKLSYAIYEK